MKIIIYAIVIYAAVKYHILQDMLGAIADLCTFVAGKL